MAAQLSQLELERIARMAENKRRMEEIGLLQATRDIQAARRAAAAEKAAARPRVVVERVEIREEDMRRSGRCVGGAARGPGVARVPPHDGAWGDWSPHCARLCACGRPAPPTNPPSNAPGAGTART